jgi:hypothetical protein
VVARAEARPGGRMAGGREARPVATEFGDDHLRRAPGDAGNRVESGERVGVCGGERRDTTIVRRDGVVEKLDVVTDANGLGERFASAVGALCLGAPSSQ